MAGKRSSVWIPRSIRRLASSTSPRTLQRVQPGREEMGWVFVPFVDENRADKMFRGKGGLPDQIPDIGGFSVAARPYR